MRRHRFVLLLRKAVELCLLPLHGVHTAVHAGAEALLLVHQLLNLHHAANKVLPQHINVHTETADIQRA
ncbi:hypothetical protein DQ04_20551000 [Trypanosoma grayi]|uniref:hypothetical protein n=1 Tax=Trypanosoma grayi TaxID=71804 RepID=UPI0004F45247|nr:hypothetical protein DQ04_20551000 [Trypanosoma grayi]KEG05554.1 hypothetical protein DQ04_20551000 [Trypanosoma grayi]